MDRIIEKKRWTVKKVLTIVFASVFVFFIVFVIANFISESLLRFLLKDQYDKDE